MKKLTIIIAFRNEGQELFNTIEEILRTAGNEVDIIVINDASDDGLDYENMLAKYNISYIYNVKRLGCAPSRDIGVNACITPYFLIIDAHMRFYDSIWVSQIVQAIEDDERAIYCCKCKAIDYNSKEAMIRPIRTGAYLNLFQIEQQNILELSWIKPNSFSEDELYIDIPCLLGACYAASKKYWIYLKGLNGLTFYGCDEQYISIKTWMEGGRIRLINNVVIGHLFRKVPPYEIKQTEFFYNKLVIIKTLLPEDIKIKLIWSIKAMNYVEYIKAMDILKHNEKEIDNLSNYYSRILSAGFENFIKINNSYC